MGSCARHVGGASSNLQARARPKRWHACSIRQRLHHLFESLETPCEAYSAVFLASARSVGHCPSDPGAGVGRGPGPPFPPSAAVRSNAHTPARDVSGRHGAGGRRRHQRVQPAGVGADALRSPGRPACQPVRCAPPAQPLAQPKRWHAGGSDRLDHLFGAAPFALGQCADHCVAQPKR